MKLYREWCLQPNQRRGTMLPLSRFKDIMRAPDAGYASVYAFDEPDALLLIEAKSSAGMNRFQAYSEDLMIDLDDGERQLKRAEKALAETGITYSVWSSGGKGFHIAVALYAPMYHLHVPYTQRKWVEALDIGADLSLYQHGRILSLPGRLHPKTGNRKTFVKTVMGQGLKLILPIETPAAPTFAITDGDQTELEQGLWQVLAILANEPEPGNRHTKLWSTAKSLADAGLAYETVLDLLTEVNTTWENPKPETELVAAIQQAFRR